MAVGATNRVRNRCDTGAAAGDGGDDVAIGVSASQTQSDTAGAPIDDRGER